jgi:hypothetical protein
VCRAGGGEGVCGGGVKGCVCVWGGGHVWTSVHIVSACRCWLPGSQGAARRCTSCGFGL